MVKSVLSCPSKATRGSLLATARKCAVHQPGFHLVQVTAFLENFTAFHTILYNI